MRCALIWPDVASAVRAERVGAVAIAADRAAHAAEFDEEPDADDRGSAEHDRRQHGHLVTVMGIADGDVVEGDKRERDSDKKRDVEQQHKLSGPVAIMHALDEDRDARPQRDEVEQKQHP